MNIKMGRTEAVLKDYSCVKSGQPVLWGHVFEKIFKKYGTHKEIADWATQENAKNDFHPISRSTIGSLITFYKKRNLGRNFTEFTDKCQTVVHESVQRSTSASSSTTPSVTTPLSAASEALLSASDALSTANHDDSSEVLSTAVAAISAAAWTISATNLTAENLSVAVESLCAATEALSLASTKQITTDFMKIKKEKKLLVKKNNS